jgi:hypothetical protein
MEIHIDSLLEGARRAMGSVAIIDVFRAFTTAAVALANGAARIIMVATVEEALALRAAAAGQICMGEVGGRAPPGFDFGNSPFAIALGDSRGETDPSGLEKCAWLPNSEDGGWGYKVGIWLQSERTRNGKEHDLPLVR